jgi:hypothetical protein
MTDNNEFQPSQQTRYCFAVCYKLTSKGIVDMKRTTKHAGFRDILRMVDH